MNRASKQQQSRKENSNGKNIYTQNQEAIAGISWTRNQEVGLGKLNPPGLQGQRNGGR